MACRCGQHELKQPASTEMSLDPQHLFYHVGQKPLNRADPACPSKHRKGIYPHTHMGRFALIRYFTRRGAFPLTSKARKIIWAICASYSRNASTSPFDGRSRTAI